VSEVNNPEAVSDRAPTDWKTSIDDVGGWRSVLGELSAGRDLLSRTTRAVMGTILAGEASAAQIAAFIFGLRLKGETVDELVGLRQGMIDAAVPLPIPDGAIDIVGVGGSLARREAALNVSTMASFIAAAAGATVCKHGNRKASSTSGSFDLLEALGVAVDLSPSHLEDCVAGTGLGFAYARTFHPAMRHVAAVRTEMGIPTVFNVLGPLSNPGLVKRHLIGVADPNLRPLMADVLMASGSERVMMVTGHEALDEVSVTGPTAVTDGVNGIVTEWQIQLEQLGISPARPEDLRGGDAADNARIFGDILSGAEAGPRRDMVVLNAAAGLVASGLVADLPAGMERAADALVSGAAGAKVAELVSVTNR